MKKLAVFFSIVVIIVIFSGNIIKGMQINEDISPETYNYLEQYDSEIKKNENKTINLDSISIIPFKSNTSFGFDLMYLVRSIEIGRLHQDNELLNNYISKITSTINKIKTEDNDIYNIRTWAVLELSLLEAYHYLEKDDANSLLTQQLSNQIKNDIKYFIEKEISINDTSSTSLWGAVLYNVQDNRIADTEEIYKKYAERVYSAYDSKLHAFSTRDGINIRLTSDYEHLLILWGLSMFNTDSEVDIPIANLLSQMSGSFGVNGKEAGSALLGLFLLTSYNINEVVKTKTDIEATLIHLGHYSHSDILTKSILMAGVSTYKNNQYKMVDEIAFENIFNTEKPLPSPEELAHKLRKEWESNPTQTVVQAIDEIQPFVEQTSGGDIESFRVNYSGACKTFVNYYLKVFEQFDVKVKDATLFSFPTETEAHSFLVLEFENKKLLVFPDSGLVIEELKDSVKFHQSNNINYIKRFKLINDYLIEKYKSNNFYWVKNGYDPLSYKNTYIPIKLSLKDRDGIRIGTTHLLKSDEDWLDMANKNNTVILKGNSEQKVGYTANLFLLGSMGFPYQHRIELTGVNRPLRVEIVFSYSTETEFIVNARAEKGRIIGNDIFIVDYGPHKYPNKLEDARWNFSIIPDNDGNAILYLSCPNVSADGQKLFVDSISFLKE